MSTKSLSSQLKAAASRPVAELLHELQVRQVELEMQNEALRQSKNTLEASRDHYADLYEFAPVACLSLTPTGLISEINLTGAALLGKERPQLLDRSFTALLIAEDQPRWVQSFRNMIEGGVPARQTLRLPLAPQNQRLALAFGRPDGTLLHVQANCTLLKTAGSSLLICVSLTDISQRNQAEYTLDRFFDQSMNLHLIAQFDGVIRRVSKGWKITLGYDQEELEGTNCLHLVHPDDKASTVAEMLKLVQEKPTFYFENRYRHKNGEFRRLAWSANIDAENQLICAVASDVTKRKQAEDQLREMAATLEKRVAIQTRRLRTISLQLAMTEERERRMLAQELHDNLSQLLVVIRIKLASLAGEAPQPALNLIVALVEQVDLSVRMISAQLCPPILGALGLTAALEWLSSEMQSNYDLSVYVDSAACPTTLASEMQAMLYRCIRELLINVARHAEVGEASLSLHCFDGQLTVTVSDSGCGFDHAGFHDGLPKQAGFGLAAIHDRIFSSGGSLNIDSSPGKGTTIFLSVPMPTGDMGGASS